MAESRRLAADVFHSDPSGGFARLAPVAGAAAPLRSFWMGGFEGADHLNRQGVPLDMVAVTGHLERLDEDYARAAALGIRTVRESIGWRLTEVAPGRYDFARLRRIADCARRHGVQVVWTFMHYGTPPDVSLLDDRVVRRFARFAAAAAQALRPFQGDEPPVCNPINEIGFLAWAVAATSQIYPYGRNRAEDLESTELSGYDVKRRLVRAVLAAIDAVRAVEPRTRFLHIEPVVHVVAPQGRADLAGHAARVADYQWQAWDLISGRAEPELGGCPEALDLVGVNHYHSGQWEIGTERRLWWHLRDPRRRDFSELLEAAWRRYGRPLLIAETGHFGAGRAAWLHEVAHEVGRARARGVPVGGICLYPLIDRPDWNDPGHWHHSGLWNVAADTAPLPPDAVVQADGRAPHAAAAQPPADPAPGRRLLHVEYAQALSGWQRHLPERARRTERRCLLVFAGQRWTAARGRLEHLMHALAGHWRIVVVEPARSTERDEFGVAIATVPRVDHGVVAPGIERLAPRLPAAASPEVAGALVGAWLRRQGIEEVHAWVAAPHAVPWLRHLPVATIVYDADGPLGAVRSPLEDTLLRVADLVVARAPSHVERLTGRHAHVHWLPDGVDATAFRPARLAHDTEESDAVRALQRGLPGPRLGCYGTFDARTDLAWVAAVAARHPGCSFVMVGPIGVARHALPRAPNLHWVGPQPWHRMPHFAASWDVCLLPWSLAHAAPCPLQPLEYLAAERPVVASALPDVVRLHGAHVRVASTLDSFARAIGAALAEDPVGSGAAALRARPLVDTLSWDRTAARAHALLEAAIARGAARAIRPTSPRPDARPAAA